MRNRGSRGASERAAAGSVLPAGHTWSTVGSAALAACTLAASLLLGGCAGPAAQSGEQKSSGAGSVYTAENEILSYKPVEVDKPVITIGKYVAFDETPLDKALEKKFPDLEIVWMEEHVGPDPITYMALQSRDRQLPDLMLANRTAPDNDFLYDLSAENFVSRYNLSALNAMNIDGRLYQIPIANTMAGIAYNKTLFDLHGWKAPESLDEFYSLCDAISAEGIRPFVPCLKYYSPLESMGLGLSFDDTLADLGKQAQYNAFVLGDGSCQGLLEPMFGNMRKLYERGIINDDDFSSSATEVRHSLYAGEYAMMPTNLDILALYNEEQPDCELDFIGYPTKTPGERWMQMIPGTKLSVSGASMEDAEKKQAVLMLLDYFSTDEGQEALFQSFSGISSLSSFQQRAVFSYQDVEDCIAAGRVFFAEYFGSNSAIPVIKEWVTGNMTMEEIIGAADEFEPIDELKQLEDAPIGTAGGAFTVLETSIFNADVMREATGADIALMLNNYYYKGNLTRIFQGEIVYPQRFILKGVAGKDYLTTYEITGQKLKELVEHPVINGKEVNAMYAPSGLKLTYAPWASPDHNVVSLILADGSGIEDDAVYTVAAWAGSIDDGYLSGVVQEYPELGGNQELMTEAIKKAGTITPVWDGRIVLNWEIRD